MATRAKAKAATPVVITDDGYGTPLTVGDMRIILSDSVRDLRKSETSAANANAISNLMGKMLSSLKLQMEYYRLIGKTPEIPMLLEEG